MIGLGPVGSASAETLAVVPIANDVTGTFVESVRRNIVAAVSASTTWDVVPPEALPPHLGTLQIQRCAGDAQCFGGLFGPFFDHTLVVSLSRWEGQYVLGLRWVPSADSATSRLNLLTGSTEAELVARLPAALAELFGSRWAGLGTVRVLASVPGTEVSAGAEFCMAPCSLDRLAAGEHTIEIHVPGQTPRRRVVEVVGGRTTELQLDDLPETESMLGGPWPWVIGAAVVVAASVVVLTATGQDPRGICVRDPRATCPP